MSREYDAMLHRWRWRDYANIAIGAWLIASPSLGDYSDSAMVWSDRLTGGAIVAVALATLSPRLDRARWVLGALGLWLLFAPLVFWARDSWAYNSGTAAGALLIAFSVVVPTMPGRAHHRTLLQPGPDVPPGWSYNPSGWMQRVPIVAMALVGFFLSRHLASYQLGHIAEPWDPFFGDGTRRVLDSDVSKAFPVSDAGLGAVSYLIEALSGLMGPPNRWRTMPWMVLLFGALVVPLGVVSIVLVILQPVAVGAWCTLCLATAVAMLIMVAPALDEVVATGQFLLAVRRERQPFWRVFWTGGTLRRGAGVQAGQAPPAEGPLWGRLAAALDLDSVPWNLLAVAAAGLWLMVAPVVLGATGPAARSDQVAGALIVTWSVVAFGEIARPVRLLVVPIAVWVVLAPWMLIGDTPVSRFHDVVAGALILALSLRRGAIGERFGGWNRVLA